MVERDWQKFPELTNAEMETMYWESPHKQITQDIRVQVVKVKDGDTITVRWDQRDFDFPVRFAGTNAPELNERLGQESKKWLEGLLLGTMVNLQINPNNRVGKFGRLVATVQHHGVDLNGESIMMGRATPFDQQDEGDIPDIERVLKG